MSVLSRFPHLKSKSTIEPIIDECLSLSCATRSRHETRRTKRVSNPYGEEGFAPAFVSSSPGVKSTRGRASGIPRERSSKRESDIHRTERERERDIERRHRGLAVSSGSRRAWKRIAALPFAFLRVSHSVRPSLIVCTYPSTLGATFSFRQFPSRRMRDSWGSASKTSKDSEESLLRPVDLKA